MSAVIRDITERTRMQAQLVEAERVLSTGLLAAGVAHEINNPLAYTLLNLERLQSGLRALARTDPGDPIADLLEAVEVGLQGGRRVQAIVRDLLGGRLAVESDAGRSSVFRLLLPAAEEG